MIYCHNLARRIFPRVCWINDSLMLWTMKAQRWPMLFSFQTSSSIRAALRLALLFSSLSCVSKDSGSYERRYRKRLTSVMMNISMIIICWLSTEGQRDAEMYHTFRLKNPPSHAKGGWRKTHCVGVSYRIRELGRRKGEHRRWSHSGKGCWWLMSAAGLGQESAGEKKKITCIQMCTALLHLEWYKFEIISC